MAEDKLPAKPAEREIATTGEGRDITRGFVGTLLTSQDSVLRARGPSLTLYEELLRDPQVAATFQQRVGAIVSREWEVVAGAGDRQSEMAADHAREMLAAINFDAATRKMMYGVFYGYAVGELMWLRDGGNWTIERIAVRRARRFGFDRHGGLRLLTQENANPGELMPAGKFWTFTAGADNDDEPYGLGLGHACYWPVWFKRNGIKFWSVYIDKFGQPTGVGKYSPNATAAEIDKLLEAVRAIHTDSGIVVPEGMTIDLLEAGRAASADYQKFHDTMDAAIAKVVLSQTMTTDNGSSRAQADVHADVRDDIVKGDADLICGSFNRGPLAWQARWNYPDATPPKVWRIMEEPEDINAAIERDSKLYAIGWEPGEEHIRARYGDGYVRRQTAAFTGFAPSPPAEMAPKATPAFAEPGTARADAAARDAAEAAEAELAAMTDRLADAGAPSMQGLLDRVATAIAAASDGEDARRRLLELHYRAVDFTTAISGQIADALTVAHLAGRADMLADGDDTGPGERASSGPSRPAGISFADADARIAGVPFREAIEFLSEKTLLPTERWTDIWQGQHARAFVVAGATRDALIADFHDALVKALDQGTTLDAFRADFDRIVAEHNWDYRGGRNWRSRVIYQTNMRMARAAGRWEQIQRQKANRPYLRYTAVMDSRTRPQHAAWHGTILPADDGFWDTFYPPNGWGCRCWVVQLSRRDLERNGWSVSDRAPDVPVEQRLVETGFGPATVSVPEGIDTGFAYNVGIAGFGRGASAQAMARRAGQFTALEAPGGSRPPVPGPLAVRAPAAKAGDGIKPGNVAELRDAFRAAIGGTERVFTDPLGERIAVTGAIVDHLLEDAARWNGRERYLPFIPELIESPQEIWVGFAEEAATGRVSIRRRYVSVYAVPGVRAVRLVADFDHGNWTALTLFHGRGNKGGKDRTGLRIYRAPES